jgi:glycosyltransferase involved in cell wall biosynthesis
MTPASGPARYPNRRMLMASTVAGTLSGFLLPYARFFRSRGWGVEALTGTSRHADALRPDFDRVWQVPWSRSLASRGNVRAFAEVRRILKEGDFDLVHVHTPIASMITRTAAASLGRSSPVIVYTAHGFHFIQGGDAVPNLVYTLVERLGGLWTDRLIVISSEDAQQAVARRIVPQQRLVHFPGVGIDLDHYAPSEALRERAASMREELGIPRTATVYTMMAEFQPGKNHVSAVEAFSRLDDDSAFLLFLGNGPLLEQVASQVDRLGLRARVKFLGFLSDIRPLVLGSAATLLPSRREGLSRSVLESLALGVPVVGGDRRGIRELVDPDLGILVQPDDVEGLTRAMSAILAFPTAGELRERCDTRLRQYSINRLIQLHEELYDDVLSDQNTGHRRGPVRNRQARPDE